MPRMSDAAYELLQDTRDKRITARSARHTRTHCGKGGAVKFPSDYLSKKELKKMNGACEIYHLGSPMTWAEFKALPDDLKVEYIKALRTKYGVPDNVLAEAMGVSARVFCDWTRKLGLSLGKTAGAAGRWWHNTKDHDAFMTWWYGTTEENQSVEENEPNSEESTDATNVAQVFVKEQGDECECSCDAKCAVPVIGDMTFEGSISDILRTLDKLLDGKTVHLQVRWDVLD